MLCFLHIADRTALFENCARSPRPGGVMFIDDYYELSPLDDAERTALAETVYCTYLPDLAKYRNDVESAGFNDVIITDKTADWSGFVSDRLTRFRAARDDLVRRYDVNTVDSLDHFYSTVANLFAGGHLGGLRLVASFAPAGSIRRS